MSTSTMPRRSHAHTPFRDRSSADQRLKGVSATSPAARCASTRPSPGAAAHPNGKTSWFTAFAQKTAYLAGKPVTFMLAAATIVIWAATGPLFGYSDTWQLVINTGTTIVTFLMVFLIQNSQNRDALAFQIKLDELILAMENAENRMAAAEDLCDEDLEALHDAYRKRASEALETLERRRAAW